MEARLLRDHNFVRGMLQTSTMRLMFWLLQLIVWLLAFSVRLDTNSWSEMQHVWVAG